MSRRVMSPSRRWPVSSTNRRRTLENFMISSARCRLASGSTVAAAMWVRSVMASVAGLSGVAWSGKDWPGRVRLVPAGASERDKARYGMLTTLKSRVTAAERAASLILTRHRESGLHDDDTPCPTDRFKTRDFALWLGAGGRGI